MQAQYIYRSCQDPSVSPCNCSLPRRAPLTQLVEIDAIHPCESPGNQTQSITAIIVCENQEMVSRVVRNLDPVPAMVPWKGSWVQQSSAESMRLSDRGSTRSVSSGQGRITPVAVDHEFAQGYAPTKSVRSSSSISERFAVAGEQLGEYTVNRSGTWGNDVLSPIAIPVELEGSECAEEAGRSRGRCNERRAENVEFIGVSKHKKSGRYEAHAWIPAYGKQVYLGGFKTPVAAAIAHDIVALKVKKAAHATNFSSEMYAGSRNWIKATELPGIVAHIKRQSRSFTRGRSRFRGVSLNSNGSWEARIGAGTNHHLYLGTYKEEESAARHYDQALVRLKGESGTTNFPIDKYQDQVKEHEEVEKAFMEDTGSWDEAHRAWVKNGRGEEKLEKRN